MLYEDVGRENGYYGKYVLDVNGNLDFIRCGHEVILESINEYSEDGTIEYKVSFQYQGRERTVDIPRYDLTTSEIQKYKAHGMDVFNHNASILVKDLLNQEEDYSRCHSINYFHRTIGWYDELKKNGERHKIFRCSELINGCNPSEYCGDYDIVPRGTLQEHLEDIRTLVIGNTPMETIYVLGLSAVVVGYLNGALDYENIIAHVYGDSSTGKTTAAMLAIATGGNPDIRANGLFRSWGSTMNALMETKKDNHGLAVGMDEISMFTGKTLTNMVYALAGGSTKDRCNQDATVKQKSSFKTTIISTGERSLIGLCSNNTGIKMRVMELKADKWAIDADNAEAIKLAASKHYGTASPALAKYILSLQEEELLERVDRCRRCYLESTKMPSELANRASTRVALILLTAELANDAFGLDLNKQRILEFIISNEEQEIEDMNLGLQFYNKFKPYVEMNQKYFYNKQKRTMRQVDCTLNSIMSGYWGTIQDIAKLDRSIGDKQVIYEVTVLKEKFKDIIKDLGFEEERTILVKLKELGYLDCEQDRFYRKRKATSQQIQNVYVIYIVNDEADEDEVSNELEQQEKNQSRKREQRVKELFSK